ncbi:putative CDP-alcohol phosphatidyltransferase class-I family protein C22A12.08c [Golovinomyces cichoracearum]|uniref:Putative CDP-alcohol phosphatidyltransferase class-I family protein C22A12.08c n=1 Tax=Golovinomyces cichoracearum TaxID=62708 RepID=A0A420HGP0_9PEZI|nr:putative CDP-alcohol phosphatidyltransferase class-I family protein C22A12.08c [Golovinomyces cichoracearum]
MRLWTMSVVRSGSVRLPFFSCPRRFLSTSENLPSIANIKNSRYSNQTHVQSCCSTIAFGFDIDGVLLRGSTPIPGAKTTLEFLQHFNIPFILLTNGGGKLEKERVAELSEKLEVHISEENFIQSHTPFKLLVHGTSTQCALENKTVLAIGGRGHKCREVALDYGFKNVVMPADILIAHPNIWPFNQIFTDYYRSSHRSLSLPVNPNDLANSLKIDAILVFNDPRDWALDIQIILDLLLSHEGYLGTYSGKNGDRSLPNNGWQQDKQPVLYFSNSDLFWAASYHMPRLGQGGFQAAFEGVWKATTDNAHLDKTIIGKPCDLTFDYAESVLLKHRTRMLGLTAPELKEIWFVGDNQFTDIKGSNEFNSRNCTKWQSILVKTGVYKDGSPLKHSPKMMATDLQEAVKNVIDAQLRLANEKT